MQKPLQNIIQFLARYSVYTVLPGFWFAYIAGISIWVGGVIGFVACMLLSITILISGRGAGRGHKARNGAHSPKNSF